MTKSIEEKIDDLAKKELDSYGLKYHLKTDNINYEIDNALNADLSKKGGRGGNYPDIKLLLSLPHNRNIPVMIEAKGMKGDLVKFDSNGNIDNDLSAADKKKELLVSSNVGKFAVNGAVHYAKAILSNTQSYSEVIAIGLNGYEDIDSVKVELGVYYVSKENFGVPQLIANYTDLSFLARENHTVLQQQIDSLSLTAEQIALLEKNVEERIEDALTELNQTMNDIHNVSEDYRVRLVAGMVMAGLNGLKVADLRSEDQEAWNDGRNIQSRILAFLNSKTLTQEKKDSVVNLMSSVFSTVHLWKPSNGESSLKSIYAFVEREILPYFQGNKHHLDFTGKLFNVLNRWVKIPDGKQNDVVLTPRYVCDLMVQLCRTNRDSYVWDYAMGTGGFLISAMKAMLKDCENIKSEKEKQEKEVKIKAEQLLGVELLNDIYVLAVLNMILMNDGSANVLNKDSLRNYNGTYEQGSLKGQPFPANVFLLNPPYSEDGKGFNFVEKALFKMESGYGAVLIQENAGSGKGTPYTQRILEHNTLVASIHMPNDLFIGKSSVQTAIYLFKVGERHHEDDIVTFVDFSNDGYARQNRRKSSASVNLRDADHVKERYAELVDIVLNRKPKTSYYTEANGLVVKDTITLNGNDWTYSQHRKIDTRPTEADFRRTVSDYLSWKISTLIKSEDEENF